MEDYGKTIFRCRVGSYLYGFNRPNSDVDYFSVFIPRSDYLLGLKTVNEVDRSTKSSAATHRNTADDVDDKSYALPKFLHLTLQNNPNIVEVFFATPNAILTLEPEMGELIENRDKLLSQRVFHTFTGYAFSQKKKLTVKSERYNSLVEGVEILETVYSKEILSDSTYAISEKEAESLNEKLKYYKGRKQNCESFHRGMSLKMIYERLIEERDNYGWRVKTDTFEELGYDCYREDTEFLTESGWKYYYEIKNEKLGTINKETLALEFQHFSDRKILPYTGELYSIENMFTKCVITPNHKMFVSQCHRGIPGIGYKYISKLAEWKLISINKLDNGNYSFFHLLNSIKNTNIDFNVSDSYLKLAGAYISEGTMIFVKNKIKCARIGQTTRGKQSFFEMMAEIEKKIYLREYKSSKIGNSKNHPKIDYTWWYTDRKTAIKLFTDFGHISACKTMPSWILKLSKRQASLLLDSMILGDGTERKFCYCYTTVSEQLASWTQILAFLSEKNTNMKKFLHTRKNGKYGEKYYIYISKKEANPRATYFNTNTKRIFKFRRKANSSRGLAGGQKINYSGNVCCFTTPNSTLITRLDGKIAIQGNCKFGYHLIRILAEGYQLLSTGELMYPIMGVARNDIVRVREGEVELPELLEMYERYDGLCKKAVENTSLPKKPDYNWADKWLIQTLKKSILEES